MIRAIFKDEEEGVVKYTFTEKHLTKLADGGTVSEEETLQCDLMLLGCLHVVAVLSCSFLLR